MKFLNRRRLFESTLAFLLLAPLAHAQDTVLVTLKLVKKTPDHLPVQVEFPTGCEVCKSVEDPAYVRQNAREIILAMRLPKSTPVELRVSTAAGAIRRVTLETTDLAFQTTAAGLNVTIPSQIADRVNSGEFQTHLYWTGVELRFEHADPERRAGDYASGDFPVVERQSAANLEFGLLDAIGKLGIDHYVDDQNLGRLWLMGFDTNFPHGHHDFPPHFHLAMWLPNYRGTGSLIPHLYLTPQGLISHSLVGASGWPGQLASLDYKANQAFTPVDMLGRPVFSLTITPEGWLDLARFDGLRCTLRPIDSGFQSGVTVGCAGFAPDAIRVEDDLDADEIREFINGERYAVFHYDRDTGALIQP